MVGVRALSGLALALLLFSSTELRAQTIGGAVSDHVGDNLQNQQGGKKKKKHHKRSAAKATDTGNMAKKPAPKKGNTNKK